MRIDGLTLKKEDPKWVPGNNDIDRDFLDRGKTKTKINNKSRITKKALREFIKESIKSLKKELKEEKQLLNHFFVLQIYLV